MDKSKQKEYLLLASVFAIATCGLIYELIAGTLASYLLGDSVTQFSIIIGLYLFSMGIGSFLSKYFNNNLIFWFIQIEILVGVIGGFSSTILFFAFEFADGFHIILYFLIMLTGLLVGLEIPLLMKILKDKLEFGELVSKVFTFDYIGALFASILFPLFMMPYLGLLKTSFLFGILNVVVAIILCYKIEVHFRGIKLAKFQSIFFLFVLLAGLLFSEKIQSIAETYTYSENIVFSKSSPYQRIVITNNSGNLKLYLNNNLQFSTADEYRYHEALVHPGLSRIKNPKHILILGGGDGLAAREVFKYNSIESITLVDLDSSITNLFKQNLKLQQINDSSLINPKIKIINTDAFSWIKECKNKFDFIVIDFPDPSNFSVGKLYSATFYNELNNILKTDGAFVVQSTSPYYAPKSFWCINKTIKSVGFNTLPYHVYVPSFGDWGYVLCFKTIETYPVFTPKKLLYYDETEFKKMLYFPKDMSEIDTEINQLNNQILIQYFEDEWGKIIQ